MLRFYIGVKHEVKKRKEKKIKELDSSRLPSLTSQIHESERHIASCVKYIFNSCHVPVRVIWGSNSEKCESESSLHPFCGETLLIPVEFLEETGL